ncbi:MAG TPA: DNA polymerase Y family protein [Rhizomicrobium sp.]|nr:DNA polymerase Y family protein [Rhizomicrobium sp.]
MWLPRLSTERLKRDDASLCDGKRPPLVIAGRANNALYVAALEARAQRLGLYKNQPLANARAITPDLTIIPADEKKDLELLERIVVWCDRFSPFVAAVPPDGLILDITGAAHLFGGEAAMLDHVTQKIGQQNFAVAAAIAGTSSAARALAKFAPGHIAAPGAEAAALARLPVAALAVDDKIIAALNRAGLKTIGQVQTRDRDELTARFGKAFVTTLEMLLGQHDQPISPRRPLPDLMAEQRFAEPIVTQDAIVACLLSLAGSLSGILEQRGLGLRRLTASFFRADGQVRRIALRLGGASRDADRVMRLLRERLDSLSDPLDPGFGFDVIRLEAMLTERIEISATSFDSDEHAKHEIQYLADRLSARHGEARVLRFVAQDTHIPEAQSVAVPAEDREFADRVWPSRHLKNDPPLRPLRLFEKPEEINVPFATAPDGPPSFFRWRRAQFDVARAEGPERIAMEWWRNISASEKRTEAASKAQTKSENETAPPRPGDKSEAQYPTRDYFRVETRQGQRFWLYRDGLYLQNGLAPRWYLHGIFA